MASKSSELINPPRREFGAAAKRAIFARANGNCERQGCTNKGEHYDHINPDYFSKDNAPENGQLLCNPCHKIKTKTDAKNIAKTKRIIKRRLGLRKKKRQIKSRGFQGWRTFGGKPVKVTGG